MGRPLYQIDPISGEHYAVGSITIDEESDKEEIVVPKKHGDNYINALKGTIYNNVLIKQNEIIDCLKQIKEMLDGR